jgi:histidine kinase-like protein
MAQELSLEIPVDPAFAVTARIFVATAARDLGLSEGIVEDLRLASSELVANAVEVGEQGPIRLVLRIREEGDVDLDATGVGALVDDPPISRRALLETLFPTDPLAAGDALRIRVATPDAVREQA